MTDLEKALAEGGQPVETDLSRALAEGGTPVDAEAAAAPAAPRSFLDRASFAIHHPVDSLKEEAGLVKEAAKAAPGQLADSFSNFGHTLAKAGKGALDLVSPISSKGEFHVPLGQLADAPYRRELERGVSDTVTAGLAEKGANAISHAVHEKFPSQVGDFQTTAASDAVAAPEARTVGQVAGMGLESPFTRLAEGVGGVVPGTGPLAETARGVAGYEAAAVPQAAIQAAANAPEGHRLEAAGHAALATATDPASLVAAGGVPAVTSFLRRKLDVAATKGPEIQAAAKDRAVNDIAAAVTGDQGVTARATDKKKIAEVKDRLYDLADKNPELREAFNEPTAKQAIPKIQEWKAKIAEPLGRLDEALDQSSDGGLDPHQTVAKLRQMAKDAITPGKSPAPVAGIGDSERLNHLADQFERIYITEREPAAPSAQETKAHGVGEVPSGLAEHLAGLEEARKTARGVAAKALDERIADAKSQLSGDAVPTPIDTETTTREKYVPIRDVAKAKVAELEATDPFGEAPRAPVASNRIPTRVFRQEVTELLKKTDSSYGAIEGSIRHQMLAKLYDAGKKIIDEHIDGSSIPTEQKAQIRDINNGYFLASRAEAAIESRGIKEANKPVWKFPASVKAAVHGGGLAGLATATALGGPHAVVHALPYVVGTELAAHALPAVAKSLNWQLAHGAYTRGVQRLIDLARKVPRAEFIGAAARVVGADGARRIYDAAQKPAAVNPASAPPNQDITL